MGPHSVAACTPCTFVPGDGVGGSDKYLGNSTPTAAACDWSREYGSTGITWRILVKCTSTPILTLQVPRATENSRVW